MEGPLTPEKLASLLEYWYAFNVDRWYDNIKEYTFTTVFVSINKQEAEELIRLLEQNASSMQPTLFANIHASATLLNLASNIDEALEKFPNHKALIRLSSRSPKDAILGTVIDDHLDVLMRSYCATHTVDRKYVDTSELHPLLYIAAAKAMEVTNGQSAMDLLTNSFRVMEDLKNYLAHPSIFPLCISLREWVDIDPAMEFRCFVYEHNMTAISQYFHDCYFPDMIARKSVISDQIQAFWQAHIKHRLTYLVSYVIDVAVLQDHVRVIELNPFDSYTGTGLFSWVYHGDLLRGKKPFCFRTLDEPLPHINVWAQSKIRKSLQRITH
eukprot:TRINITY_DN15602_c0_g3_i2.p1 TRINITY_DN15602_c0_g3~~TRINITY_DN15602_c0_g3_i2.p1  ORF type:complete len:326 (+),score=17.66 TRINITY_DN15602_c0_g3_i2:20-997(+)